MEQNTKTCSRCGGVGTVCKGQVINGVCYGCNGTGKVPVIRKEQTMCRRVSQFALVNAQGWHLAINTDRKVLESLQTSIAGAVEIIELRTGAKC